MRIETEQLLLDSSIMGKWLLRDKHDVDQEELRLKLIEYKDELGFKPKTDNDAYLENMGRNFDLD